MKRNFWGALLIATIQSIFTIAGIFLEFVALIVVGRQWIATLAGGVRGIIRFQTRRMLKQAQQAIVGRSKVDATMAGKPRWWDFLISEYRLAGYRALAKQQDHWNRRHRAKWVLGERRIVDVDGFFDAAAIEQNGRELENHILEMVETGTPRDLTGLAFILISSGLVLQALAALPLTS